MQIVICDDEKAMVKEYTDQICMLAKQLDIPVQISSYASGAQLLFEFESIVHETNLLLLDIAMPGGTDGMAAAKQLREKFHYKGGIVFITKSENYAIRAFDVHAFHYIVKRITSKKRQLEILKSALQAAWQQSQQFLLLKGVGEYRNIPVSSIDYFEANGHIITVHYGEDKTFEFCTTMEKLESTVLAFRILRVHRSFLVSLDKIASYSYREILLKDGASVPLGRKYMSDLKTALGENGPSRTEESPANT